MSDEYTPQPPGGVPPPPPPPGPGPVEGVGPYESPGMPEGYGAPPPPSGPGTAPSYQPQPPQKKSKAGIIILIVVVALLVCCLVGVGLFYFVGRNAGEIGRSLSDSPGPGAMSVQDQGYVGESGSVAVWLSWDTPVDMDLEIWDAAGENMIAAASEYAGQDITSGADGDEYFEFTTYRDRDFSTGEYVVSIYYWGSDDGSNPDTEVTVTAQDADGRVQTFTKTVKWDPGYDQWHAFRIDAATGAITPMDTFF